MRYMAYALSDVTSFSYRSTSAMKASPHGYVVLQAETCPIRRSTAGSFLSSSARRSKKRLMPHTRAAGQRLEQRLQQHFCVAREPMTVGADAVDRGVEVVQTDVYAVEGVAADDLPWPARACRRS